MFIDSMMKNFPQIPFLDNLPNALIEVEIFADTVYYILYGKYDEINNFKNIANEYFQKNNINKKYIVAKLNLPVINIQDEQEKENKTKFDLGKSLESIQCMVYAECNNREAKNMFTLLSIEKDDESNKYVIKYPTITISDKLEPEESIYKEIKKINNMFAQKIKDNVNLLDIAGEEDEILVYSIKVPNVTKKKINVTRKKQ